MSTAVSRAGVPAASRVVVEGVVRRVLRRPAEPSPRQPAEPRPAWQRVVLVHAAAEWRDEPEFDVDGARVRVVACATVLAVLDALSEHADGDAGTYLVVVTPCGAAELGAGVLARVAGQRVRSVNRWDLVREAFGARQLDPQLTTRRWAWAAAALLDAQPAGGWPKIVGSVLDIDTAMRRLTAARLWRDAADVRLDAAALLEWTREDAAVASFAYLGDDERAGLEEWTAATVGPVARVVFRLAARGHAGDAVPFGLATGVLLGPGAPATRQARLALVRAEERYFAGHPPADDDLRRFAETAESLVVRWTATDGSDVARAVLDRAGDILAELRVGDLAEASSVLDAGFDARLGVLAGQLAVALPEITPADLPAVEDALSALRAHHRWPVRRDDAVPAEMAVRLARWLATDSAGAAGRTGSPASLADLAAAHLSSWSFADRALAAVWDADTSRSPALASAYARLCAVVRERRAELDRVFAERLAAWVELSGAADELLGVENVLQRVARPLARHEAPLVVVLDGMSAAVGSELAEQVLARWPWLEVGRRDEGREPALATVPSTTTYSRASLLSGTLAAGGQDVERAGFAACWRGRRTGLFHKGGLRAGGAAVPLPAEVRDAIRTPGTVVGVVLNTVDESLDHGREAGRRPGGPRWELDGIAYLRDLLGEAWLAGRPVLLVADHGHVLDRGDGVRRDHADAARWRSGVAGDGELLVRGARVLADGGDAEVVVPWDERIRYVPRRAGYHGGVSPAEMVVPVLAFVPSRDRVPRGWPRPYDPGRMVPDWWEALADTRARAAQAPAAGQPAAPAERPRRRGPAPQDETLFGRAEPPAAAAPPESAAAPAGLGARVTGSPLLEAQRTYVRKAPPDTEIAALVDGLERAGGKLPVSAAAGIVGQPAVRMSGYLAQASRLLNVDGYQVLEVADGGRTVVLNTALLREQFL